MLPFELARQHAGITELTASVWMEEIRDLSGQRDYATRAVSAEDVFRGADQAEEGSCTAQSGTMEPSALSSRLS